MKQLHNISLKHLNTFGIDVLADEYIECDTEQDINEIAATSKVGETIILGGGSNMLFMNNIKKRVVHVNFNKIEIVKDDDEHTYLRAGAGTVWDDFVKKCVEMGLYGAENLSGIPGTVGASPVQNIGAYGYEAGNIIDTVEGYFIGSGEKFMIKGTDCQFGYRQSIFKKEYKDKIIVSAVTYKLQKHASLKLDYGTVRKAVDDLGGDSLENVRTAIMSIRNSKLPDPKIEGNAGSFFKNPEVNSDIADALKAKYIDMPTYQLEDGRVKIPAGWLIEKSGWKGKAIGEAAVHSRQALVLVNKGDATGSDIMRLATTIQNDVSTLFGIHLDMEVCKIE